MGYCVPYHTNPSATIPERSLPELGPITPIGHRAPLSSPPYRRPAATPAQPYRTSPPSPKILPSFLGIAMHEQFIITIGYRAKAGRGAELEKLLRDRVPISRTEAGNLDYRLYTSITDPHVFFLFARFASEKSFDVHMYQPYTLSMLANLEELLEDPPRVETYKAIIG